MKAIRFCYPTPYLVLPALVLALVTLLALTIGTGRADAGRSHKRSPGAPGVVAARGQSAAVSIASDDDDGNPGDPARLRGQIEALPAAGVVGEWTISGRSVLVTQNTVIQLSTTQIALGTPVKVKGNLTENGILTARKIEYEQEQGDEDAEGALSFRGIVLETPHSASGEGEWYIRTGHNSERTVFADAATRLSSPLPQKGQWVEVEGRPLGSGVIQATQIRLDNYAENEIVVRLQPGISAQAIAARYDLQLRRTVLQSGNIYLFAAVDDADDDHLDNDTSANDGRTDESVDALIAQLQDEKETVVWAERNYVGGIPQANPYQTWAWGGADASGYTNQSALDQIQLAPAQSRYKGDGVIVAVLDTGVSTSHAQLTSHLLPGIDLVDDDADPNEEGGGLAWGHGTHISGIIARTAPNSKILPVRVLDASGRGDSFLLAYGIEWAVTQGADVINLSLGTPYDSQVLHQAIGDAIAAGVVVVAAAGNQGESAAQYPASYAATIAVTAVDVNNRKADFANYGDWVDLAAPGVGITSTIVGPATPDVPDGNGYASWSGTSMATSFVSGVAAMVREKAPDSSAAAVEQLLVDSGGDLDGANPNTRIGKLLNADGALPPVAVEQFLYLPGLHK